MSTNNYVNFWADVSINLPSERTDNTLYFVTDTGEIYKGSQLVANLTNNDKLNALNVYYGECTTAAATADKVTTVDDTFTLQKGVTVIVKFTDTNGATKPTLNVNNSGAKPIYRYGTTAASTTTTTSGWPAGAVQILTYDGTGWIRHHWYNTTYSTFVKSGSSAAAGLVPKPSTTTGTTKYLRENATWAVPPDTKVTSVGNHYTPAEDADSALSASSTTAATWGSTSLVTGLKRDAKGHVVGVTSIQMPANPNTIGKNVIGAQDATSDSTQTDGNVYLTHVDGDDAVQSSHQIKGSGKVTVTSDASGNITITGAQTTLEDLGLGNAVHFLGTSSTAITDGGAEKPTINHAEVTPEAGDVVLYGNQEFIYNAANKWELFGDEGSYALKTVTITGTQGLTGGGDLSNNREIKANLKNTSTQHTLDSAALTNTSSRQYAVALDKSGYLSVNIPWTDTNTKMYHKTRGTTKTYILGTSTSPTSSNVAVTGLSDSKIYIQTNATVNDSTIVAPAFKGRLLGRADTATLAASANVANLYYGTCDTDANTAAKTVDVNDTFTLKEGATIIVKFTNNNSANNPTLSVNETDAKPMVRYGSNALGTLDYVGGWYAGAVQMFTYDGTSWVRDFWANTTYVNFKPSGPEASGGLVPSPPTTAGITKFLREDGRWVAPPDNDSIVDSAANHYLPETAADQALNVDASSTTAATWGTTSLVTGVNISRDEKGHVTGLTVDSIKMPANPDNDTKNTAGATNTSSKIFLVGATSQDANPQTYTHDTAYVNTDGALYSENAKVATQTWTDSAVSTAVNGAVHGTAGRIAKFNTANEVVNSIMTESNSVIDVAGNIQAEAVRIGGKVTLQYQNDSLDFIFS